MTVFAMLEIFKKKLKKKKNPKNALWAGSRTKRTML